MGLARFKVINGAVFILLGLVLLAQFARGVGLRWEGLSGYVLALALIGLGAVRLRGGWPRRL